MKFIYKTSNSKWIYSPPIASKEVFEQLRFMEELFLVSTETKENFWHILHADEIVARLIGAGFLPSEFANGYGQFPFLESFRNASLFTHLLVFSSQPG